MSAHVHPRVTHAQGACSVPKAAPKSCGEEQTCPRQLGANQGLEDLPRVPPLSQLHGLAPGPRFTHLRNDTWRWMAPKRVYLSGPGTLRKLAKNSLRNYAAALDTRKGQGH